MTKLSTLQLCQILSYVEYFDLKHFLQINHKCQHICNHLIQVQCLERNLTSVNIPIHSLYLTPSILNGDSANDEFTTFDYKQLTQLSNNSTLKALCFSYNATTEYHLLSNIIRQLPAHSLTKIDLGTYDIGEENIIKYATLIGTTQTSLKSLTFWKDPGKNERFSGPREVEMFSNLVECENLRCFVWSPSFVSMQKLSALNIFYHLDTFNDSVNDLKKLPNLCSLILRSTTISQFSSIHRVSELSQLTYLNITGTQIVKDPGVFSLDKCTNLKHISFYYIDSISEEIFNILKYSSKFYIQLQLYSVPLENQQFAPFNLTGIQFDPKRIFILHMTMIQRKIKSRFAKALFNRFQQWPPNLYFKGYLTFDVTDIHKCIGISDSLVRLEFHFIQQLLNLKSVNSFSYLTSLSIRHCRIKTEEPIPLNGLISLKRLYISDCDNVQLLSISDITGLTSFTLKDQTCFTPLLPHLIELTNLKQIVLSNIRIVTDNDIEFLILLDNIRHYTFDENSVFQEKEKYFATPTRTVSFVTRQD
ncbi:hypothetical protein EDI_111380 [Entamoeba dispar SAW760]|uniref:F-box domain-containing protein n=1 Tax=Entamoeba dispar (strain ATCC PRA-260 / SAW760) TaxID=370354 RepID=B0EGN4_ENTDS|nr:uncharacterized protein EDI_111380 [Entamoeba dispar SAW760]EDR26308.1 hypothetical protein EDI_111380 [Entamoeba dispar SAW760]|eukprot:EDR26308.1 hypothetical protein EDI_111380 [Entamoeba dispar SAW760]